MIRSSRSFPSLSSNQAGSTRLAIIIVVAAALLAVAGYFMFFRAAPEIVAPSVPLPPAAKEAKPEEAREIISEQKETTETDYEASYQKALAFMEDGQMADAQLLLFYAARAGHGPSALVLAGLYDPVSFNPATSLMDKPDAFQAFKWYSKALEAGEEQAAAPLEALKSWCETAAAEGNQQAAQLLLQWEQS
jgi:TPR repeat protein